MKGAITGTSPASSKCTQKSHLPYMPSAQLSTPELGKPVLWEALAQIPRPITDELGL